MGQAIFFAYNYFFSFFFFALHHSPEASAHRVLCGKDVARAFLAVFTMLTLLEKQRHRVQCPLHTTPTPVRRI